MPAQLTATRSGAPVATATSTAAWTDVSSDTSVRAKWPADVVGDLLAAVLVQVRDEDGHARRGEDPHGRLAEPARAAGNDRRSTVQLHAREHTCRVFGSVW